MRVVGCLAVREGELKKKGDSLPPHTHNFDHVTEIVNGPIRLVLESPQGVVEEVVLDAFAMHHIPKDHLHSLIAEADDCRYRCIYPHRDKNEDIVDEYVGYLPGYI